MIEPVIYYLNEHDKYEFDNMNRVSCITTVCGKEYYEYDEYDRLIHKRNNFVQTFDLDWKGKIDKNYLYEDIYYAYNELGLLVSIVALANPKNELLEKIEYEYYESGQIKCETITDPYAGRKDQIRITEYYKDGTQKSFRRKPLC